MDTKKILKSILPLKTDADSIKSRLHGTRWGHVTLEFFTNTFHFPLANIFLELLTEGFDEFIEEPDLYIIIPAAIIQAFFLGTWKYKGRPKPLLGNLIGPAIYSFQKKTMPSSL